MPSTWRPANGSVMDRNESLQIELIRVLCILSMMWVHVSPGFSFVTYVNEGPMDTVGLVLGRTLGRISVTTLSFVSGYLFWRTAANRPFAQVLNRVLSGLLLPMLVWSGLFLTLAVAKGMIVDEQAAALGRVTPDLWGIFNAWSGLAAPTANLSLFFIRDLIVATVILRLAVPLVSRLPGLAVVLALATLALPQTAPLLFRPSILLFMVLGAVAARSDVTLVSLSRPRMALLIGLALTFLTVLMAKGGLTARFGLDAPHDLLRRAGIGLLMLALTRALARLPRADRVAGLGRHGFLAYLSHVTVIGIFWVVWQRLVGPPTQPSYLVFYLAMPLVCLLLAALAGRGIDKAPALLQLLVRGKVFLPDPVPRSSPA